MKQQRRRMLRLPRDNDSGLALARQGRQRLAYMLLALCMCSPVLAEETPPAPEMLELPAFDPQPKPKTQPPVTLELLPEAEVKAPVDAAKPTAEASPPPAPEPAAPPLPTPEVAVAAPEPPVTPPAATTVAQEAFGPPAPRASSAATAETYGPPASTAEGQATTLAAQLAPVDPAQDIIKDGWNEGSLMFSAIELQKLREALLAPPPEVAAADPNAPAGSKTPPPPVVDYAAFYLHSVIFHSEDHWSVWLNGHKFFPGKDSPLERVTIESVGPGYVTFRWEPARKLAPLKDEDGEEKDDPRIQLEPDGTVRITLASNQTMLTAKREILEGRGLTQEIRALIAANTAAAKAAAEAATAAAVPTGSPPNQERRNMDTLVSQQQRANMM